MDARLKQSAEDGDVDALYLILADDPYVLQRIDQIPFVDTPLHIAARNGKSHYAMEIASLKPSYAWKLNHLGLSPIHLALENRHEELVMWFTTIDSELVRVKGKGMITPLHYVAEKEYLEILSVFLCVYPSSINDLTVKYETAVHVALKNGKFSAFQVLFGWLRRVNKEVILNNQDEDGNNALHIATSTNQPAAVKMLIRYVNVNTKNGSGLTAMDVFCLKKNLLDAEVGKILRRAKAKRASELEASGPTSTTSKRTSLNRASLNSYLSSDISYSENLKNLLGIRSRIKDKLSNEVRSIVLVVAILIATATYGAILSPPGGYWQDNGNTTTISNCTTMISNSTTMISNWTTMISNCTTCVPQEDNADSKTSVPQRAGEMILSPRNVWFFFAPNSAAFILSVCIILIIIVGLPFSGMLAAATILLSSSYFVSLTCTFPSSDTLLYLLVSSVTLFLFGLAVTVFYSSVRGKGYTSWGRWRVNLGGFI